MRFWCISTSPENWDVCKNYKTWGMDARYYVTLDKYVRAGDKAVVYTHGGRFVAIVEFLSEYYFSDKDIGWKKGSRSFLFPYRIDFRLIHESGDPPRISFSVEEENNRAQWNRPNLIDNVVFIADKGRTWNQYLQVSIVSITDEDFNTLSSAIQKS